MVPPRRPGLAPCHSLTPRVPCSSDRCPAPGHSTQLSPHPRQSRPRPVGEREQGFRDRAKREDERFRLATDGEFWLAFCFRKPHQPAAFVAAFRLEQLPGTRYVPGPKLAAAVGDRTKLTAAQRVKQLLRIQGQRAEDLTAGLSSELGPNPLADVPDDRRPWRRPLEELRAIHRALNAPPPPNPADVMDSPHWFVAYFPNREDKEAFLTAAGLDVLGDKYIDGHQAARILGIELQ